MSDVRRQLVDKVTRLPEEILGKVEGFVDYTEKEHRDKQRAQKIADAQQQA
jgi:hypothetical protein